MESVCFKNCPLIPSFILVQMNYSICSYLSFYRCLENTLYETGNLAILRKTLNFQRAPKGLIYKICGICLF